MLRALTRIAAATGIAVAAFATPASAAGPDPAAAALPPAGTDGWTCDHLGICGDIHNSDDQLGFYVAPNWGTRSDSSTWRWLSPGQSSQGIGIKDADGLRVAPGCSATIAYVQILGAGWWQVHDNQEIFVTDYRC